MDAVRAAHKWRSHKEKLASYMDSYCKKSRESTSSISVLVAPPAPLLFPHLKFQHKKAYFRGKRQGSRLSESWRDTFGTTLK
jgi:hypothetical protein